MLLKDRAKSADLHKKKVVLVALGDRRYHYTAGAGVHLEHFVQTHNGEQLLPRFSVIGEPFPQVEVIKNWAKSLAKALKGEKVTGDISRTGSDGQPLPDYTPPGL
jgi:flavodoxin I